MPMTRVSFIITKKFNLSIFTQWLLTYSIGLSSRKFSLPLNTQVHNRKPLHRETSSKNSDLRQRPIYTTNFILAKQWASRIMHWNKKVPPQKKINKNCKCEGHGKFLLWLKMKKGQGVRGTQQKSLHSETVMTFSTCTSLGQRHPNNWPSSFGLSSSRTSSAEALYSEKGYN